MTVTEGKFAVGKVKNPVSYILKIVSEPIKGLSLVVLGVLMASYPSALPNPSPEAITLWQGMGGSVVLYGFIVALKGIVAPFTKTNRLEPHEEILHRLEMLQADVTALRHALAATTPVEQGDVEYNTKEH